MSLGNSVYAKSSKIRTYLTSKNLTCFVSRMRKIWSSEILRNKRGKLWGQGTMEQGAGAGSSGIQPWKSHLESGRKIDHSFPSLRCHPAHPLPTPEEVTRLNSPSPYKVWSSKLLELLPMEMTTWPHQCCTHISASTQAQRFKTPLFFPLNELLPEACSPVS